MRGKPVIEKTLANDSVCLQFLKIRSLKLISIQFKRFNIQFEYLLSVSILKKIAETHVMIIYTTNKMLKKIFGTEKSMIQACSCQESRAGRTYGSPLTPLLRSAHAENKRSSSHWNIPNAFSPCCMEKPCIEQLVQRFVYSLNAVNTRYTAFSIATPSKSPISSRSVHLKIRL